MVPLPHRTQSFPTASNLRQQHRIHSEELTSREKVLLLRISLLEKQVTEAALQQHLDNRRIQLSHHSVRDSVSYIGFIWNALSSIFHSPTTSSAIPNFTAKRGWR